MNTETIALNCVETWRQKTKKDDVRKGEQGDWKQRNERKELNHNPHSSIPLLGKSDPKGEAMTQEPT